MPFTATKETYRQTPHPAASGVFDGQEQVRFDDLKDQAKEVAVGGVRLLHFNQLKAGE